MEIISMKTVHENLIRHLQSAKCDATLLKLDYHFLSEIDHLIATAEANREDGK